MFLFTQARWLCMTLCKAIATVAYISWPLGRSAFFMAEQPEGRGIKGAQGALEERVRNVITHIEGDGVISMHLPIDYIRVKPDFKGTVARDFLPLVFFMNPPHIEH